MSKALDKYATSKEDLKQLTSDEVKWMLSAFHHFSVAHLKTGNQDKAHEYLSEIEHIFQQLGIKDTIDVALNDYHLSSILISQERFVEAEKYLNEVTRICKLFANDHQAKSLTVQSWYLLAQVENQFSQDKALELYSAILKNIGDVDESALSALLPNVYKDMGKIYRSRDDIDNMIKFWENGLHAAIKYFGENSTLAFTFLCDIVDNLAIRDQYELAERYAENRVKMALKVFPNPHENVAISYSLLGNIYFANEKCPQAINAYNQAFKVFERLPRDYSHILYDVYFSMATAQHALDNHQEASDFLDKADQALIKVNGEPNLSVAAVYCRWANDLNQFEMLAASKKYYQKALDLYKTLDPSNKVMIFSIYSGLGQIAFELEDWDQALELWKEAEKYLDPTDHPSVQMAYMTLDSIYSNLDNDEESEKCVQKILQSLETTGDTSHIFDAYYESGEYYEKEKKLEEALPCYEVAARVYEKDANKDPAKAQNLAAKISQIKKKMQKTK